MKNSKPAWLAGARVYICGDAARLAPAVRETLARGALGIEVQQLGSRIACLQGGFTFRLLPLTTTQRMQGGMIRITAGIAADQMHLGNGHIELGFVGELQHHEFGITIAQVEVG